MKRIMITALFASTLANAATPVDGWYTGAFGGISYLPGVSPGLLRNGIGYNGAFNLGARVGYQSNPLRYEGEYTFVRGNVHYFEVNRRRQNRVSGYSLANILMGNVYYDFPDMLPAVSPFLGVGIGYAAIRTDIRSNGPFQIIAFHSNNNAFAYQGTAGLTYNFSENYAVNVAYRYIATSDIAPLGNSFQAHNLSLGGVFRFDQIR
jgi:opacity protein-like surface antigen